MQTIPPQLPPLLHQQTFNNHSKQRQISISSQHLQPTLYNMLPQLVYLSSYHQPTFDTVVTPNPAYLQTACEIWSCEPYHSTPAQPPPSHLQEQLPFTQPTGYLTNRMHNLDSFLAPSTDVLHSNQSLPT